MFICGNTFKNCQNVRGYEGEAWKTRQRSEQKAKRAACNGNDARKSRKATLRHIDKSMSVLYAISNFPCRR